MPKGHKLLLPILFNSRCRW